MARQGNLKLVGTENGIIYYKSRGEFYMRKMPGVVNQAEASIAASGEFGKGATLGKQCRTLFSRLIPNPKSKEMQNALGTAFYYWLLAKESYEFPPYNFVPEKDLAKYFNLNFEIEVNEKEKLCLKIPEFNPVEVIKGKTYTSGLSVSIGVACVSDNPEESQKQVVQLDIPYEKVKRPEEVYYLNLSPADHHYLAVGMSIKELNKKEQEPISAIILFTDITALGAAEKTEQVSSFIEETLG